MAPGFARFLGVACGATTVAGCLLSFPLDGLTGAPADGLIGALDGDSDVVTPPDALSHVDAEAGLGLEAGAGADGGHEVLRDDFERADASDLGNGWIEEDAADFSLVSGAARFDCLGNPNDENAKVSRPAGENLRDIEVSVDVTVVAPVGYPIVFVRAPTPLAAGEHGYLLAIQRGIAVAIQREGAQLSSGTLAGGGMVDGGRYRLTLRVTGSASVSLSATVTELKGGTVIGAIFASDFASNRFSAAGTFGFSDDCSTGTARGDRFDNFVARAL